MKILLFIILHLLSEKVATPVYFVHLCFACTFIQSTVQLMLLSRIVDVYSKCEKSKTSRSEISTQPRQKAIE